VDRSGPVRLVATMGAALLVERVGLCRRYGLCFGSPSGWQPEAVARAVDAVGELTIGSLIALALEGAHDIAGPWIPKAATELAKAYRCADGRAAIAEALATRFASALHSGVDRSAQEWWNGRWPAGRNVEERVCLRDFGKAY